MSSINMTVHEVEQGTAEWRELRVGRMTSSNVGAALGHSPFKTRKQLLKEMAEEATGIFRDIGHIPAVKWGNDHEQTAAEEWAFANNKTIERIGFVTLGDHHGSSPDFLVGDEELLEVKCPYSLREMESPRFKPIAELKHYYDQVQHQLFVTGRQRCHFLQWAPGGTQVELVELDPDWILNSADDIVSFLGELDAAMEDPDFLKVADEREDAAWELAAEELKLAQAVFDSAEADLKACKETLKGLAGEESVKGCGVYVRRTERKGSIDYRAVTQAHFPDTDDDDWEDYRREGSVSVSVGVEK
jgi:putative phage-type endonuclease